MSDDAEYFVDFVADSSWMQGGLVRLFESKMFHQFDHRWASLSGPGSPVKGSPVSIASPRYLIPMKLTRQKMPDSWGREWLISWRDITNSTNERTLIATVLPMSGVGHSAFLAYPAVAADLSAVLVACLCSFVVDFSARLKISGTHFPISTLEEVPCIPAEKLRHSPPWDKCMSSLVAWFLPRVLELIYTAWDLHGFAADCGYRGAPFRWDGERRLLLRCEMDAAFFHLYGVESEGVNYVMESFPKVKGADFKRYGEFRTKHVILEVYDRMQRAIDSGVPYQSRLAPPPADPSLAHPADTRPDWLDGD